ncbi:hypothetical protein AMJ71_04740 [candidate division TA06 bacterium SM1_40]|uniref:Uncharacterized protein n=1 Tax=candidate division TA06 bacterium SM1_40 TaxID=1703773 RepID=A0A0S8JJX1_UNCT6|nr:MAG: hypothetical protein AMJ71_04740 [candidate division TA06 bacterium SM1_40]
MMMVSLDGARKVAIIRPLIRQGGKVIGTSMTMERRSFEPAISQRVGALIDRDVATGQSYVSGSRTRKPYTPCFPGLLPVMNEVQAGPVIGGMVDSSSPHAPCSMRRASVGTRPCSISGPMTSNVPPSSPKMTSLFLCLLTDPPPFL